MYRIKCITFNKEVQDALPERVKEKMKVDRAKAREEKKQRYTAAFMYACPIKDRESNRCGRGLMVNFECSADCGAIKDFINFLETEK